MESFIFAVVLTNWMLRGMCTCLDSEYILFLLYSMLEHESFVYVLNSLLLIMIYKLNLHLFTGACGPFTVYYKIYICIYILI